VEIKIDCFESKMSGGGCPTCCIGKNCIEERMKNRLDYCQFILMPDGAWIENFQHGSDGKFGMPIIVNGSVIEFLKAQRNVPG